MRWSSPWIMPSLVCTVPAAAQSGLSSDLLSDWQRNRSTVLSYIDAMPDSATGFRPTPGVRTFAEQFDHIVTTNLLGAAAASGGHVRAASAAGCSAGGSVLRALGVDPGSGGALSPLERSNSA